MAVLKVPIDNQDPSFTFTSPLEGQNYRFFFRFNSRLNKWTFNVRDSVGNDIIKTLPFFSNIDLLKYVPYETLPQGILTAYDTTELSVDADRFNFGNDIELYYQES